MVICTIKIIIDIMCKRIGGRIMKSKKFLILIIPILLLSACTKAELNTTATPSVTAVHEETTPSVTVVNEETSKPQASANTKSSSSPKTTTDSSNVTLSQTELSNFSNYFNQNENNGFLLSYYKKPAEIDLAEALFNGAGITQTGLSDSEKAAFLEAINESEIYTDVTKLTTNQINTFLKKKTGLTLTDITKKFTWVYLSKYDTYYFQHGDTNFSPIECISGYKTKDGLYVIKYRNDYMSEGNSATVTLKQSGSDYLFVSNIEN